MCDTIKNGKLTRDAMDITNEVSKVVKFLPKRNAIFDKLKEELSPDTPGFRVLCPTHWTVRAKSLQSLQDNCSVLQKLWEFVLDGNTHPDVRTRVIGVRAQMESFEYFFDISVAELVLRHCETCQLLPKAVPSQQLKASVWHH